MFDVAGGVRCRKTSHRDVATAIGRTQTVRLRSGHGRQASQAHWRLRTGTDAACYSDAIRDSRIAYFRRS